VVGITLGRSNALHVPAAWSECHGGVTCGLPSDSEALLYCTQAWLRNVSTTSTEEVVSWRLAYRAYSSSKLQPRQLPSSCAASPPETTKAELKHSPSHFFVFLSIASALQSSYDAYRTILHYSPSEHTFSSSNLLIQLVHHIYQLSHSSPAPIAAQEVPPKRSQSYGYSFTRQTCRVRYFP
jgi:hypothetical protein